MNQLSLIFQQASRNTDPISSHLAEQEITRKGLRGKQATQVLELVKEHPGLTARELSVLPECDLDRYQVSRRTADLENAGLLEKSGIRECRVGGRKSVVWRAT